MYVHVFGYALNMLVTQYTPDLYARDTTYAEALGFIIPVDPSHGVTNLYLVHSLYKLSHKSEVSILHRVHDSIPCFLVFNFHVVNMCT